MNSYIFTADADGYIKQWNSSSLKLVKDLGQLTTQKLNCMTTCCFGQYLLLGTNIGNLQQYQIQDENETTKPNYLLYEKFLNNRITSLAVASDLANTDKIYGVDFGGNSSILILKKFSRNCVYERSLPPKRGISHALGNCDTGPINGQKITNDNKQAMIGYGLACALMNNGGWAKIDLANYPIQANFEGDFQAEMAVTCLVKTSDDKYVFTSHNDNSIKQWCFNTKALISEVHHAHGIKIWSIDITKDNKYLFTSGWDGLQKQWSVDKRKLVKNYGFIHEDMNWIYLTKDGKYLLTSDAWGVVQMWNVKRQSLVKAFGPVHDDSVISIVSNDF